MSENLQRAKDLTGKRFGSLYVLGYDHGDRSGSYFLCECDCGTQKVIYSGSLKSGATTSCGCKQRIKVQNELNGKRFGHLKVLGFDHSGPKGLTYLRCLCDCGNEAVVLKSSLVTGHTSSCGCRFREAHTSHNLSKDSLYPIWDAMRQRCENSNSSSYERYGGRGIDVCEEWHDVRSINRNDMRDFENYFDTQGND